MTDQSESRKRHVAAMTQLKRMFQLEGSPRKEGNASRDVDEDVLAEEVAVVEREFEN